MKTSCLLAFPFGMNYPCRYFIGRSVLLTVSLSLAPPGTNLFIHWTVILLCYLMSFAVLHVTWGSKYLSCAEKVMGRAFKANIVRCLYVFLQSNHFLFFQKYSKDRTDISYFFTISLESRINSWISATDCRWVEILCRYPCVNRSTTSGRFPKAVLEKIYYFAVCN